MEQHAVESLGLRIDLVDELVPWGDDTFGIQWRKAAGLRGVFWITRAASKRMVNSLAGFGSHLSVTVTRVREEVYYREALALGLDKDDSIVRRRLQQKLAFVTDDVAARTQPTDDELNAYLQAHLDQFRVEQTFTFRHVFLDPEKHGDHLARDGEQLVARLNQAAGDSTFASAGDPFMPGSSFTALPAREITQQFGAAFSAKLAEIPLRRWQWPVESSFGKHVVFLAERTDARVPALSDVRDAVSRDWESAHRAEANDQVYQEMLKRYTVTIEGAAAAGPK